MKAAAAKKYRRISKEQVESEKIETGPWELARVSATFFFKNHRRRDPDNAMASLKSAYDGIVDAGLVVDDDATHMKRGEPEFFVDKVYPRVVLKIERLK